MLAAWAVAPPLSPSVKPLEMPPSVVLLPLLMLLLFQVLSCLPLLCTLGAQLSLCSLDTGVCCCQGI